MGLSVGAGQGLSTFELMPSLEDLLGIMDYTGLVMIGGVGGIHRPPKYDMAGGSYSKVFSHR